MLNVLSKTGYELTWHIDDPQSLLDVWTLACPYAAADYPASEAQKFCMTIESIWYVQADGDELDAIVQQCAEIRYAVHPVVRWVGQDAQFIVLNLRPQEK